MFLVAVSYKDVPSCSSMFLSLSVQGNMIYGAILHIIMHSFHRACHDTKPSKIFSCCPKFNKNDVVIF